MRLADRLLPLRLTRPAAPDSGRGAVTALDAELAAAAAPPPGVLDAWFAAPLCRDCGADLAGKYCHACGQEQAARLGSGSLRREAWDKLRWFEASLLRGAWRLLRAPGRVAREYVLGRRKRHVHPLKLLAAAIAVLVLVVGQTHAMESDKAHLSQAMAAVRRWSDWSFSLGILAILATSWTVFGRRLGYNLAEHLVLAVYTHFLVLVLSILGLLPLLVLRDPAWVAAWKTASAWPKALAEAGLVALACAQFFLTVWRRDGLRLLAAAALFLGLKKALLWLYAWALVQAVLRQWL